MSERRSEYGSPHGKNGKAEDLLRELHDPAENVEVVHNAESEIDEHTAEETFNDEKKQNIISVLTEETIDLSAAAVQCVNNAESVERIERQEVENAETEAVDIEHVQKICQKLRHEGDLRHKIQHKKKERIEEERHDVIHHDARARREPKPQTVLFEVVRVDGNGFRPSEPHKRETDEADEVKVFQRV